ncbi:DUF4435 domain-containing protein [Geminocystis sp. GBBB08]|uniref:DUF4435 domain-containing protein n=1 Tax=Geminocystis sp. GBBB08 TaxID=2604140 RepID=UPI0027E2C5D6|nr:DUF4435 domain-containing protein [Geminocystis sp. GBBB08]MBL1211645.1 DUF4435 domain-containing protein [Geminocystis sp. GBBB08]
MREYLTVDRIANTIRQQKSTFEGNFILVEGDSDKKLYQNFIDESNCRFQICKGKPSSKQRVIQVLDILNKHEIKGIIGIVDADFDHLENTKYNHNNLFLTDYHDLEMMLINSPALDKLLIEFASEDKLKKLKLDMRQVLLNLSYELGYLRWISKCEQLNLTFNNLDYTKLLDIKRLTTDLDKLIQTVINKTQNYSISKEDLLNKINIKKSDILCKYQICCGHDMIEILSILLRKTIGSNNANEVSKDHLERSLRLAYEKVYFKETNLYVQIIEWQKNNLTIIFDIE